MEKLIIDFSEKSPIINDHWIRELTMQETENNSFKYSQTILNLCNDNIDFIYTCFKLCWDISLAVYISEMDKLYTYGDGKSLLNSRDFLIVGNFFLANTPITYKSSCINTYINIFFELTNPLKTIYSYSCN